MKALKTLVIAMGSMIVVGTGFVGYGLTRTKPPATTVTTSVAPDVKGGFFTSELPVPRSAHLEQVVATGDRVVLRFSAPEGEKLVLLDAHSGQLAGTIALIPDIH